MNKDVRDLLDKCETRLATADENIAVLMDRLPDSYIWRAGYVSDQIIALRLNFAELRSVLEGQDAQGLEVDHTNKDA